MKYREMKSLKKISEERKEKMKKESKIVHEKFERLLEINPLSDVFRREMLTKYIKNAKNKGHSNEKINDVFVNFLEYPEKEVRQIIEELGVVQKNE